MKPGAKGVLLVFVSYIVTAGMAVIIAIAAMILLDTTNCGAVSRALPVLLIMIAAVFLASVIGVGVLARKITPGAVGRLAIVVVYGATMLVSFVIIAFILMMAFNC